MVKGGSKSVVEMLECREALVNTDELEAAAAGARRPVLEIRANLHRWARNDPYRQFDDVFNPILRFCSWRGIGCGTTRAPRRAGVDGQSAYYVQAVLRVEEFLDRLRTALRDRSCRPVPVCQRMIPKAGGKQRRLGIATVTDRVVHAFLTGVWEAILEADFLPCTTVSIPDVALMTRSPRPAIWRFSPMSGSSRVTSRRAPMRL
jgi:RNA-directed DNA polymerase